MCPANPAQSFEEVNEANRLAKVDVVGVQPDELRLEGMGEDHQAGRETRPVRDQVGVFTTDPALQCDHTSGCITCGDEAVAMTVLKLDAERGLALCADDEGRRETVEVALVEAAEGDVMMVHAATAIARVEVGAE